MGLLGFLLGLCSAAADLVCARALLRTDKLAVTSLSPQISSNTILDRYVLGCGLLLCLLVLENTIIGGLAKRREAPVEVAANISMSGAVKLEQLDEVNARIDAARGSIARPLYLVLVWRVLAPSGN